VQEVHEQEEEVKMKADDLFVHGAAHNCSRKDVTEAEKHHDGPYVPTKDGDDNKVMKFKITMELIMIMVVPEMMRDDAPKRVRPAIRVQGVGGVDAAGVAVAALKT
jgi:hypothetical protein